MKTKAIFIVLFTGIFLILFSGNMLPTNLEASSLEIVEVSGEQTSHSEGHHDPYAKVFEVLAIILLCATIGRYLSKKIDQSPVLGELLIGIVLGSILYQMNFPSAITIRHYDIVTNAIEVMLNQNISWNSAVENVLNTTSISTEAATKISSVLLKENFSEYSLIARSMLLFSSMGVILLIFMVGLENSLKEMRKVGGSAVQVALLGILIPFALGYTVTMILLPESSSNVPLFMGATLCATSIGITARVFKDMGRLSLKEAKIVMGAAVIDDVLGLIVLAIVTGIVTSGSIEISVAGLILLKAFIFLGVVIIFGAKFIEKRIAFFSKLDKTNVKLLYPFTLLMILSWAADMTGLATIVGAFAAGLIIEERFFTPGDSDHKNNHSVESIIAPIEGIFAPVFFVLIGFQVDIFTFTNSKVLITGLLLTIAAIIGKLSASFFLKKGTSKLVVGIGMVPRGEVGLIFASIGKSIGILDNNLFSIIIIVVLLTTIMTPPALKWAIERSEKQ